MSPCFSVKHNRAASVVDSLSSRPFLRLDLSKDFDLKILEMHDHPGVMQLKLDHAFVQPPFLLKMFSKLGRELAVDEELELIAFDDDVDVIPVAL